MSKKKIISTILIITLLFPVCSSISFAAEGTLEYAAAKEYMYSIGYDDESLELMQSLGMSIVDKAQRLQQLQEENNYIMGYSGVEIEEVDVPNMDLTDAVIPDSKLMLYIFTDTGWDYYSKNVSVSHIEVAYNWINRPVNLYTDAMTFTCGDKWRLTRFGGSYDMMIYGSDWVVNNWATSPAKATPRSVGWFVKLSSGGINPPTGRGYTGYAEIELEPVSKTSKSISDTLTAEYVHSYLPGGLSINIGGSFVSISVTALSDSKAIIKNYVTGNMP